MVHQNGVDANTRLQQATSSRAVDTVRILLPSTHDLLL